MKSINLLKRNMRRTPYQALAACMVMFLTFLTFIGFLLLTFGSQKIISYYESKPQAIIFFKDGTKDTDITAIQNALVKTGRVTSTQFVSKEEALQNYRDKNKDKPALLELVTANILPASLEVSTLTPADLSPIAEMLKNEPVIEEIVIPKDVIQSLTKATAVIRWTGGGVVVFLIGFALIITVMIIGFKIRIKRNEIAIMRLLGASTWFIRAPFLLEGIAYGVIGAFSAWVIVYGLVWYFNPYLEFYLEGIPSNVITLPVPPLFMLGLLFIALFTAVLIGGLGSYVAVKRHLKS